MPEDIIPQRDLIQIVADFHSVKEKRIGEAIKVVNPNVLYSLGDMDRPETVEWWEKEKRHKWEFNNQIKVYNIIGDHELNIVHNLDEIRSAEIVAQGGFQHLVNRLKKDHKELSAKVENSDIFGGKLVGKEDLVTPFTFLINLLDYEKHPETYFGKELFLGSDLRINEEIDDDTLYKLRFLHGALDSCYSNEELEHIGNLWNRLTTFDDYTLNFEKMKENGDDIMIRGHDHKPAYACMDTGTGGIHIFEPFQAGESKAIYIMERWKEGDKTIGRILQEDNIVYLDRETKNIKRVSTKPGGEKVVIPGGGENIEFEQYQFLLGKERKHVVTAGAICDGWTATIDCQEVPVLQFHNTGNINRIRTWRAGLGGKGTIYDSVE